MGRSISPSSARVEMWIRVRCLAESHSKSQERSVLVVDMKKTRSGVQYYPSPGVDRSTTLTLQPGSGVKESFDRLIEGPFLIPM